MSEPYTFVLRNSADFDGSQVIEGSLSDFQTTGRTYERQIDGGGVVPATFWGAFSSDAPKIVGISTHTENPNAVARLLTDGNNDLYREQLDMRLQTQHVLMLPNDTISLVTVEGRGATVELLVQALSEENHQEWARRYDVQHRTRRFRIMQTGAQGWNASPDANPLALGWTFDDTARLNSATTDQQGVLRLRSFFSRVVEGVECWVRFSNIAPNSGKVYRVEGSQYRGAHEVASNLSNGEWSDAIHLGFDDLLDLETSGPPVGQGAVVVDLEFGPPRNRRK